MRCMGINKQTIWYAQYLCMSSVVDKDGHKTGEKEVSYTEPRKIMVNVSAAKRGATENEQFGISTNYQKTIMTDDVNCPIDEHSILWIDTLPTNPHNYVVSRIARSINSITYAIKEVGASE